MPLNLGNRVISQHLTIDEVDASVVKATQLGTAEKPVETIHRASTDVFRKIIMTYKVPRKHECPLARMT